MIKHNISDVRRKLTKAVIRESEKMIAQFVTLPEQLYTWLVQDTPVDTGLARGNWIISLNSEPAAPIDRLNIAGLPLGEEVQKLQESKPGDKVVIANNLVYIESLERGHSQQAPSGMVLVNILTLKNLAQSQGIKLTVR